MAPPVYRPPGVESRPVGAEYGMTEVEPVKARIIVIARSTCDEAIQLALRRYGLLRRGACHRARIRATRWLLAMTLRERSDLAAPITCKSARCRRRPHRARLARSFCIQDDIREPPGGSRPCRKRFGRMRLAAGPGRRRASAVRAPRDRGDPWNRGARPAVWPPASRLHCRHCGTIPRLPHTCVQGR